MITIGDELLIGDTVNTNSAWMGRILTHHNIGLYESLTIGDERQVLFDALDRLRKHSDVILITGGLGPTHDDITKPVLTEYTGAKLIEHQPTKDFIVRNFDKRGIPVSPSNLQQAMVPDSCEVLFNTRGTAPGMWFELSDCLVVALPGVPAEMKHLMTEKVIPKLAALNEKVPFYSYRHYFHTAGIGESTLSDMEIGDVSNFLKTGLQLAFLPHTHGVSLRVSSSSDNQEVAREKAKPLITHIRKSAGDHIYSENEKDTLPVCVVRLLTELRKTVAVAESCTGGLLGSMITDVPGSSACFLGGMIAYQNELKTRFLDVPETVLEKFGAVSPEVAMIMAKTVAKKTGASIGVSTTGIAGPGGGTEHKPVGLVYFGYYDGERHFAMKQLFFRERKFNKERTALVALDLVRRVQCGISRLPYDAKPILTK